MQTLDHNSFPTNGPLQEQILFALGYAVRAPSTHNSQPWLFKIDGEKVALYADMSRQLPEGDKDKRDMYISLGACLHHAVTAFNYFQMINAVDIGNVEDANEPVAVISVHPSLGANLKFLPSIIAIEKRFNARGPFLPEEVGKEILDGVMELCQEEGVTTELILENKVRFAELTGEGMRKAHSNPSFRKEISRWMINNYSSRKDGIPGYTMLAPGPLSLILPFIIGTFNMGKLLAKLNFKSINSSSGVIILSSPDKSKSWLRVGIEFQRISLFLNSKGIFTSVFVATIEMPEIRARLKTEFKIKSEPQFAFAFGFPKIKLRQSPRFSPSERML